ncbi:hypothetical protein M407DRAFT_68607 [Tulasnella calospora MUT 4182]|uniref:Protein CPL1-like domain-containing protein n=1 Tax=Tulasnella calospora MUT 4182 TaxID=1051891 RepID=A0A0C3QGT4_9AGAM|nr:hypothetical protein M407DRAFT_68607 [Tulasnella calospora MUT 4182]
MVSFYAKVASCPFQRQACPIFSDDLWVPGSNTSQPAAAEYECVATLRDLDNCGGCTSTGEGTACTSIEGVRGASCVQGKCEISTSYRRVSLGRSDANLQLDSSFLLRGIHP